MGYQVKWVEENLGVSRKALRNFEKMGLMEKNEGGGYRDYSDEDIEKIWMIRVFQGIGYSLKEIVDMVSDENFDYETSLEDKIKELESEKEKVEKHLGYAKNIKLSGRLPARPKSMGSITFGDFYEKSLNEWNLNADSDAKRYQEVVDFILNTPEEEWKETDLGRIFEFLQGVQEMMSNTDVIMMEKIIPLEIIKRKANGPTDPEVQLLVKMIYDNRINSLSESTKMSLNQFVRFESSSYLFGDVARMKERDYGKEGCAFIADAIAVFGGYNCYDEVED